jgi:predicted short-subunit dehydrogenase-like oxidoreductase (DUF2520 family)
MNLAIIGRGKLGSALEKALITAGHVVLDDPVTSELIILCVPDDAIAQVSQAYQGHPMAHTSGSNASTILAGNGLKASMHPIQTVRSGAEANVFHGIHVSLEGHPELTPLIAQLVTDVGAIPLPVTSEQKKAIHLAAVMVSNFTIALHMMADEVLKSSGIDTPSTEMFKPLLDRTIANLREVGPAEARTGPAVRGDLETIRAHLAVLHGYPSAEAAYKVLSEVLVAEQTNFNSRIRQFLRS